MSGLVWMVSEGLVKLLDTYIPPMVAVIPDTFVLTNVLSLLHHFYTFV